MDELSADHRTTAGGGHPTRPLAQKLAPKAEQGTGLGTQSVGHPLPRVLARACVPASSPQASWGAAGE